ncbi:undecaprenyl-diphosphate phosphatase [Patulibacter sp.]|uniref:undecaprenyl-diphosphate phosphatase n=1 Tax=Patulibacter sp. TaxID=1912859 RepID=UPI002718DC12|nr:undecaprenyl-diphosphate phosphatase [Patulibacter sp.]MDO9408890.1 undecaprenyl-diphosphate phosphatase [Patulibacter sp.]
MTALPTPTPRLSPRRSLAAALLAGALHGPAEALPVSSSAHVAFVARLAAGRRGRRPSDPEVAKSVEVGAHAGTLLGLTIGLRGEARKATRGVLREPRLAAMTAGRIVAASVPAVIGALTLERQIEDHLGGDRTIAAGLVAGSVAMVVADALAPGGIVARRRHGAAVAGRPWEDGTVVDALLIGTAQAAALWPGVSRSGAVLVAARARGFSREASGKISAALAVPAVGGATALKVVRLGTRLRDGTIDPRHLTPLLAVTTTGALSGVVAAPMARRTLEGLPLWPFAGYRLLLAGALAEADRRWRR